MTNPISVTNPLVTQEDIDDHFGIGLIVRENGKFPIFWHEKYQFWTIPVGKAPSEELVGDMVITEAQEELGITPTSFAPLGSFNKTYDRDCGIHTKITTVIFNITSYTGDIENKEPEKHPQMLWVDEYMLRVLGKSKHLSDCSVFFLGLQEVINRPCLTI